MDYELDKLVSLLESSDISNNKLSLELSKALKIDFREVIRKSFNNKNWESEKYTDTINYFKEFFNFTIVIKLWLNIDKSEIYWYSNDILSLMKITSKSDADIIKYIYEIIIANYD
jgi:hypothetical protein